MTNAEEKIALEEVAEQTADSLEFLQARGYTNEALAAEAQLARIETYIQEEL